MVYLWECVHKGPTWDIRNTTFSPACCVIRCLPEVSQAMEVGTPLGSSH